MRIPHILIWILASLGLVGYVVGSPTLDANETNLNDERANLADSIKMVIDLVTTDNTDSDSSVSTTLAPKIYQPSTGSNEQPEEASTYKSETPKTTSAELSTSTVAPQITEPITEKSSVQTVQVVQISNLPSDSNLFNGLAQNVGTLNIGGIIMEAFTLAQNAIRLFGQSLTTQFGNTGTFIITNTTKIVGTK